MRQADTTKPGVIDLRERFGVRLPAAARLAINRCSLPADILGGPTFQVYPAALELDGVAEAHKGLIERLGDFGAAGERAQAFTDYMTDTFRLEHPEDLGFSEDQRIKRSKADYLRLLRGWSFDSDGREGAVLKGWVESRFGLLARHHKEPLGDDQGPAYQVYIAERTRGLYNTGALEAQLDLLYLYSQYELRTRRPDRTHQRLYRGVNRLGEGGEILKKLDDHRALVLFNNLNSFSTSRERADEFGDSILSVNVPIQKMFCFSDLLPGRLRGENEVVVIGGVYEVSLS
ncbi:MAG: NAD(+)--dinitrogen-reductase ADP-D-ribosyltransferase [Magnetovibrionaceae bacterium]